MLIIFNILASTYNKGQSMTDDERISYFRETGIIIWPEPERKPRRIVLAFRKLWDSMRKRFLR